MPPINALHGAAATSQRLASAVAIELLQAGGSAVDAALGANAMLSLIEPHMCGPGGDLFALVYIAKEKKLYALNSGGWAPSGWTPSEPSLTPSRQTPRSSSTSWA